MLWSSKPHDPAADPHRLAVATHELGHYVAWRGLRGARLRHIRVTGRGTSSTGSVRFRFPQGGDLNRGWLVGLLAGMEADLIHQHRTGHRIRTSGWAGDRALFKKTVRNHLPSRAWTETELRTAARRLLLAHWDEIEELAPRLAERGHL